LALYPGACGLSRERGQRRAGRGAGQGCLVRERARARHPSRREASGDLRRWLRHHGWSGRGGLLRHGMRRGVASHTRGGRLADKAYRHLGGKTADTCGPCTDHLKRELDRLAPLEGRMADIDWKPLPTGLWTPPAVFAEVGNLFLQAFTGDGVPTWEVSKKTAERGEWNVIAKGTANSFEAAKAAALFEAGAAREGHEGHEDDHPSMPTTPTTGSILDQRTEHGSHKRSRG